MMTGAGWAMGLGGWLWMLLALAVGIAIVVAFVWLVTAALPGRQRSTSEEAVRILKARFARGEISEQEYEQARRLLGLELSNSSNTRTERTMTTKRVNLLAGTILGGALLLGTAGLVFAQDPTTSPSPSAPPGMSGGMMGGQGQGMMGGQGQGMMGGGMGAGQMPDMAAMHAAMGQDGTCDPELMQSMHRQYQSTR